MLPAALAPAFDVDVRLIGAECVADEVEAYAGDTRSSLPCDGLLRRGGRESGPDGARWTLSGAVVGTRDSEDC